MLKNLFSSKKAIPIYRKKRTRILGLFLWAPSLWAATATYCFHRPNDVPSAMAEVNSILLKDEGQFKLDEDGCLTGQLRSETRFSFFENYLSKRYPLSRTIGELTSSTGKPLPPCHLIFEAKGQKDVQKNIQLIVAPGIPGKISFQGEELEVICRHRSGEAFELEISRRNNSSSLTSIITAKRGQAIQLGSMENSEQEQQHKVNVGDGIERTEVKYNGSITYTITAN